MRFRQLIRGRSGDGQPAMKRGHYPRGHHHQNQTAHGETIGEVYGIIVAVWPCCPVPPGHVEGPHIHRKLTTNPPKKDFVVVTTDTSANEWTVMVELDYAMPAFMAVFGARGLEVTTKNTKSGIPDDMNGQRCISLH